MATQTQKIRLIDELNVAFEKIQENYSSINYKQYFKKLQKELEMLILTKSNIKKRDITNLVNEISIPNRNVRQLVLTSLTLSGITNVIENQQLPSEDRANFLPIIGFVALYGLNVKLLSEKADKLTKAFLKRSSKGLSPKEVKGYKLLRQYYVTNQKVIDKQIKSMNRNVAKINKEIRSSTSKSIFKDYNEMIKKVDTQEVLSERITKKHGELNRTRIERTVRTETKRLNEITKLVQHESLGYTHKRWNTQQDRKVSKSHQAMQGVTIKVDKKFTIPGIDRKPRAKALYPGDPSLPVGQRINERCFLTYLKRV